MHVSIRLHLVHAVVAAWSKTVSVLGTERRALDRMRVRGLRVTIERLGSLLGGRRFEAGGLTVDRRRVRCLGSCASTNH
jgi:biotin carboxylase